LLRKWRTRQNTWSFRILCTNNSSPVLADSLKVEVAEKEAKIEQLEQELAARTGVQRGLDVSDSVEVGDDL